MASASCPPDMDPTWGLGGRSSRSGRPSGSRTTSWPRWRPGTWPGRSSTRLASARDRVPAVVPAGHDDVHLVVPIGAVLGRPDVAVGPEGQCPTRCGGRSCRRATAIRRPGRGCPATRCWCGPDRPAAPCRSTRSGSAGWCRRRRHRSSPRGPCQDRTPGRQPPWRPGGGVDAGDDVHGLRRRGDVGVELPRHDLHAVLAWPATRGVVGAAPARVGATVAGEARVDRPGRIIPVYWRPRVGAAGESADGCAVAEHEQAPLVRCVKRTVAPGGQAMSHEGRSVARPPRRWPG